MDYPDSVSEMLGPPRVAKLQDSFAALSDCVAGSPERVSWVMHSPIALASKNKGAAERELVARLRASGPDWFYVVGVRPDGTHKGFASNEFRWRHAGSTDAMDVMQQFLAFDIHSALGGWTLSHLWRAADLADAANASFARWQVLPAAACARALLEKVSRLLPLKARPCSRNGTRSKKLGRPHVLTFIKFRDASLAKLLQGIFGSRRG